MSAGRQSGRLPDESDQRWADRLVEDPAIVRSKPGEPLTPVHGKQVLSGLRLRGLPIHFDVALIENGISPIGESTGRRVSRESRDGAKPKTRVSGRPTNSRVL